MVMSRAAWNNLLIFSMLIMLALFNGLHRNLSTSTTPATPIKVKLLPENRLLTHLDLQTVKVKRVGQTWQFTHGSGWQSSAVKEWMHQWQTYQVELLKDEMEGQLLTRGQMPRYYVVASLAGQTDRAVYAFYPQLDRVLVYDQTQQQWSQMPIEDLSVLFPPAIF